MHVILPMRRADVTVVERIAHDAFGAAWPIGDMTAELDRSFSVQRVLRPASGAPVCAFLVYWVIADEAQVIHVAVDGEHQRSGFGRLLMLDALVGARVRGCTVMTLEVRRSNRKALALYDGLGFDRVGVRPRYYSDNGEDAILMSRGL